MSPLGLDLLPPPPQGPGHTPDTSLQDPVHDEETPLISWGLLPSAVLTLLSKVCPGWTGRSGGTPPWPEEGQDEREEEEEERGDEGLAARHCPLLQT